MEDAQGGTLFLDEVGELALTIQARLLRFLQERKFERVGGVKSMESDVRVIAATNRDLNAAIQSNQFRMDLFYRLNVVSIEMPALHSGFSTRPVRGVSQDAMGCMIRYAWPGNVRELENAIQRAMVLGAAELLQAEDFPDAIAESGPESASLESFHEAVVRAKREIVMRALDQAGGNYNDAAKTLGVHPNNLHRLIRSLRLR